jgi:hypothetical protein
MSLDLPSPIAAYVAANARLDAFGMVSTFASDAVVHDNGDVIRGHAELRPWLEEAVIAVKAVFTPDTVRHGEGQVVVEGPVHGEFKGSPIRFTYRIELDGDAIQALEIRA